MEKFDTILGYAIRDHSFRKGLVNDPANTIEIYRSKLGFGVMEISEALLDTIGTLTDEEIKAIAEVKKKMNLIPGGEEHVFVGGAAY